ncbi:MAG: DUF664 domain-containing protein [Bacteroidota bacterium]
MSIDNHANRRNFLKKSAVLSAGLAALPFMKASPSSKQVGTSNKDSLYLIGPQKGYTPMIGTLLSTMTMMRTWVVRQVQGLSVKQLDFLLDNQSNSIGALLWHLAATERYYQLNTFEGLDWGTWSDDIKAEWDIPMNLGKVARKSIKGHSLDFYLEKLDSVREVTKQEFAKRNDDWLLESETFFDNLPTNNHAKWFHVCEHESNHNGQIKIIRKRMPK